LNDHLVISVHYDSTSTLPIAEALCKPEPTPTVNITLLEEEHQSLTAGQKLLLEWNYRVCHLNFQSLQHVLMRAPFIAKRVAAAVQCAPPRCEIGEMAKAKLHPRNAENKTYNPERDGPSKQIIYAHGYVHVSVDYSECRQPGYTPVILMGRFLSSSTKEGVFLLIVHLHTCMLSIFWII
jgi:hypothetical protein